MSQQNSKNTLFDVIRSRVTGIGSVPFLDVEHACDLILQHCPDIPYIPQLPRIDAREKVHCRRVT